jgi:outer membrane receptor protein involved in Fe transport
MKSTFLTLSVAAASLLSTCYAEEINLDPIVVGADFREQNLSKTAVSVSIISEDTIAEKASQPFIEVLASTPNVNFSAGASKAKHIQIRGIGERSQFETPINPSVGVIVDGMDFSQNPLGVSLFDVKQVEVLRGPQGTTFGANGMAGVIVVESNEPTSQTEAHVELNAGNYNSYAVGAAVGGTLIDDKVLGRLSVYKNSSDGYMENSYLGKDDTNGIDELTIKAALKWFVTDSSTIDLNYIHADIDNGYDAFTLDNSWVSHADKPGKDTQDTDAFSLKYTNQINSAMHLVAMLSHSSTDSEYSYDEDWSYVGEFDDALWPYDWFDQYLRDRKQTDVDIRLISDEDGRIFNDTTKWTLGVYYKDYSEDMRRNHFKDDHWETFTHNYDTVNKAVYGQIDSQLTDKLLFTLGLRAENWDVDYSDSNAFVENNDENLYGGKIGLSYQADPHALYYVTLSRGYKPGGVNADNTIPAEKRTFETETLWNVDAGLNSSYFNHTLMNRLNFFYGKRKDQQVKAYIAQNHSFSDYFDNAAKGTYYGLESELDYYPNEKLHLYSKLGLLHAEFDKYTPEMTGRAPAQSPKYQYNIGFDYSFLENFIFKANLEGMGSYYFSNTHNQKSDSYTLVNSSISYIGDSWSATLWGRNLADREYDVRGFYFGNNPAHGYDAELYTQKGAPRTFGLTLSYDY